MKPIEDMVWPVENYTDRIHFAICSTFCRHPNLSFTKRQMFAYLLKRFVWLRNPTEYQTTLLNRIIHTATTKLVQNNAVVLVKGITTVEKTWQHRKGAEESSYTNITTADDVLNNPKKAQAIKGRSIGAKQLWKLNHAVTA